MNDSLDNLVKVLDKIKNPVTKGTLKQGLFSFYESLNDEMEDHQVISSFLAEFNSFVNGESQNLPKDYGIRQRFRQIDTTDKIKSPYTKGMFKAMANSAIDSLADPWENHDVVNYFFNELSEIYQGKVKPVIIPFKKEIQIKKYGELSESEMDDFFDAYRSSGMTRRGFVESYRNKDSVRLSSVYALDKLRKECRKKSPYFASGTGTAGLPVAMAASP